MLTKKLSILITAGVLIIGIAMFATAEDKGKTIMSQEQVRSTEQHEVLAQAGDPGEKGGGDQTMTQDRTRDHMRDGIGDHDPDRFRDQDQLHDRDRDRDRIHDHQGMGTGGMGGGMMGDCTRGPRR